MFTTCKTNTLQLCVLQHAAQDILQLCVHHMQHRHNTTYYSCVFTTNSTDILQLCILLHAAQTYYNYAFTICSTDILQLCISPTAAHTRFMYFTKCSTYITHNIYVFHQMQHRHTLVMSFTRCCTHILCAHHRHTEHTYCVLTTDIQNTHTVCSPPTYRTHLLCAHH